MVNTNNTVKHVEYLDGFQYAGLVLQFFSHPEGYVNISAKTPPDSYPVQYFYNYVYNYTDHLGNVRLSYAKDPQTGNLKILDESHYYPFGLKHQKYLTSTFVSNSNNQVVISPVLNNPYQYKYNGKEFQDELGLNFYDYGARNYDPALGRWMNYDPLAEQRASLTSYNYVSNNPIVRIDPTGMLDDWYQSEGGDYVYDSNITGQQDLTDAGIKGEYLGESHSFNVTQDGSQIGAMNLNADGSASFTSTDGQITEFNDMTIDMGFTSGNKIMAGNYQNGDLFDKGNFTVGAFATGMEYTPGSFRFGTTKQGLSPKYYGNNWGGNQFAKTFNIGKIGRALGRASVIGGVAVDIYKLSNGTTSPGKAGLNATMGTIGLYGGPIGAAVSGIYFGVDAFYPGGWEGALDNSGSLLEQNQAIIGTGFNLYKDW